jgi:hypothetical protein
LFEAGCYQKPLTPKILIKMLTNTKKLSLILALFVGTFVFVSCQKNGGTGSDDTARLQVRLTDNPNLNLSQVWVDVKEIQVGMGDSSMITLAGSHPGMYNLLALTNGKDTLLSDAQIPAGRMSQIRLVLGTNNYAITKTGERIELTTPSAQQSGLKVQVNQTLTGGMLYRLILDFDAAKSVVQAGNSGKYILKPVLRIISFVPSGGNVKGVVLPGSVRTAVYAIKGPDTIATTYSDTTMKGAYYFHDIAAGSYNFSYVPQDTIHLTTQRNVTVTLGQTTTVDTVRLLP